MADEPKSPGRQPKPEKDRKSSSVKFRTRGDLWSRLSASAQASGRTLSEEAEKRMEASFERDDLRQIIREEVRAAISTPGNGHCHTGLIPHWQHDELRQD